jgi:PAS domain S-box-containing protein
MPLKVPLLRPRGVSPARAPVLRYGVAVLSVILALIPALLLSDVVESRLVVFAVAIMVSAWYGGWKPGLVATSFALTVSAYFSMGAGHSPTEYRRAIIHLILFVVVALLICWFNAALRSAQEGLWRSEVNFRSLVTNAPYGICRCDAAGILLNVNPALVTMLGYSSAAGLVGRSLPTLFRESQEWFTAADHFGATERFTGLMADWVRQDGTPITVRLSGRTLRDHGTYFQLFAEDVTERRALEQQLRQAQKMEAVGRLAGGIAHDFNNLLMVIAGYCEFLLEGAQASPQVRGPAEEIAKAAKRAIALTGQLLAFGRKQMLTPKVLDLNGVVTENLKLLGRVIGEDIELVMISGRDLGLVKADPGQMEQVIMNLAVNARDAMPQGGKLTIETANATVGERFTRREVPAAPGDYVMLSVSDNGLGMDAETQAHIFEPFFSTKGLKGTGLGLSTVYGIVKQSGGYIWVTSEPNQGTTFRIYLPRVSEPGEDGVAPEASLALPEVAAGHETILLVEDETTVRELTRQYLETLGYKVFEAPGPAVALEISNAHEGPIHLLLSDVIMPGMNGRELAQRIVSARPETRVLYISGYSENVIGHNGTLEAGINLLQKPFALPTLKTKVRQVLDRPLSEEALMAAHSAQTRRTKATFRAQRFRLHLPLRYREIGAPDWRAGTTEDISRSGMLFQAEALVLPSVQLEINLVLPPEIAGLTSAEVLCRGEVVRALGAEAPAMKPKLAAKILQYQFQQGSRVAEA